eukprot:TRINITY_DN11678_c0_g1_i1.p1 TRINITY_DN11678_c0_g1~~TRINITY_DN11678_c0_g1_i1.p1  ORF type:complete len:430 (-),score=62.92 TRINITY_DN11678_c0_g1_i1:201-1382(-)
MATAQSPTYVGVVKSFNPEKGWGHIECEETHKVFGKDIFLLRSHVPVSGIAKGATVMFSVSQGLKGPEATGIQVATNIAGRYVGVMKSWNAMKGWGHIESEETHQLFGKDMFVLRSALMGGHAEKGDMVTFSVSQGSKGPEAADVQLVSVNTMQSGNQNRWSPTPTSNSTNVQMTGTQGQYRGVVKSFNFEKGWGHISCDETWQIFGKDMFMLRSGLQGQSVVVGDEVTFTVTDGLRGPEATKVIVAKNGGPSLGNASFTGYVKSWDIFKGYGFIICEESFNIYGRDVFVHNSQLWGRIPRPGEEMRFNVLVGADGRPEARGVEFPKGRHGGFGWGSRGGFAGGFDAGCRGYWGASSNYSDGLGYEKGSGSGNWGGGCKGKYGGMPSNRLSPY